MSAKTEKTREEILAERQEKKKKKAALKNQPKDKKPKEAGETNAAQKNTSSPDVVPLKKATEVQEKKETVKDVPETIKNVVKNQGGDVVVKKDKIEPDKKPENNVVDSKDNSEATPVKTKAQLKAERRAKQEAERAKKLEKAQTQVSEKKIVKPDVKPTEPVKVTKVAKVIPDVNHKAKLFAHLYNAEMGVSEVDGSLDKIHPSIVQLGTQYSSKVISGANACCLAVLNALKKVVMNFETPQNQEFSRGLEAEISKSMTYLSKCRPLAVSMINAVKHLKYQVNQSKGNELECKNKIIDWIDDFIKEQLEVAADAICLFVKEKIAPGDVILTYGCSSLIEQILISVHNEGINFQVVVVDGRPWLEGREMLKKLVSAGIHCTYVFVNGVSFIMREVTKILLGAHALLANGYVMSLAGSSQIALLAKTYNIPVLVCCETYKFSERVQTDSFVYNELGDPDDLASKKGCLSQELAKWKSIPFLTPLNLTYDVTPPDLVSAVVTEIAVLPCTSVPVILRIKPPDVSC